MVPSGDSLERGTEPFEELGNSVLAEHGDRGNEQHIRATHDGQADQDDVDALGESEEGYDDECHQREYEVEDEDDDAEPFAPSRDPARMSMSIRVRAHGLIVASPIMHCVCCEPERRLASAGFRCPVAGQTPPALGTKEDRPAPASK